MRKTKIICTLGPSTDNDDIVKSLMLSGMSVARFNFSHQTHVDHKRRHDTVVRLREELGMPIGTLLDTKGPEIRIGKIKGGIAELVQGKTIELTTKEVLGTAKIVTISFKDLPSDIEVGQKILIDDGLIELVADKITSTSVICTILNGGTIKDNKGVNIPGTHLSMPYVSEQDKKDILFGIETGFDFIAASFVRTANDLMEIKHILDINGGSDIKLIAKIENADGVENLDDILRVADGIMVARGDMGVEIPFEHIPVLQKMIIKKAYNAGKQVITATQMLDSMMHNPRPTRAETTDVANAIYDGTSAIMLSGETAAGIYPVEAVKTMATIAERAEMDIDYIKRFNTRDLHDAPNVTNAISHATVTTAHDMGAAAIITVTKGGQTAKMISKFRPFSPIIGCSTSEKVCRQLNLSWGVIPLLMEEKTSTDALFENSVEVGIKANLLSDGDLVVITAGIPLGIPGTTNMLKVHLVGNILASCVGISDRTACGRLCVCKSIAEALETFEDNDILVLPHTTNELMPILKRASAVVTEETGRDSHAAVVGLTLDIPVIVGVDNATKILTNGITATIDASKGIIGAT